MRKKEYLFLDPKKRGGVEAALIHDLRNLPADRGYMVTLSRVQEPISEGQKKLWWVWMQIIGDVIGDTKGGVYESLKHDMIGWLEGRGITDISHEEMHYLMTQVQIAVSSIPIYLPSSMNDYYRSLEQLDAERGADYLRRGRR